MISVIVPVYNVEPYLQECLDSIISQSYTDLQIIIIDDGSTDGSGAICDAYAAKDMRIQVVHQENRGLSAARNRGIELATGEYLTFVDSDDYLLTDYIETLYGMCLKYNADMCVCSYDLTQDGKWIPLEKKLSTDPEIYTGHQKMQAYLCERKIGPQAWGKLYASELFCEIRYPIGKLYEDAFVIHKLVHAAKCIVRIEKSLYVYRKRPNSITTSTFSIQRLDIITASLEAASFMQEHYPDLLPWAESNILSACTDMVLAYAPTKVYPHAERMLLQSLYRKYLIPHLKYARSLKHKVFAIIAFVSIKPAELLACWYGKIKNA